MTTRDVAAAARRLYAEKGFSIFPVPAPVVGTELGNAGDGKTPATEWKPFQHRRATEGQVRQWWRDDDPDAPNVAIVTGAISGVVVLDADNEPAQRWIARRLPMTPWFVATARGFHFYFRHPGAPVPNRSHAVVATTPSGPIELDVRGDAGFVVGPQSLHHTGAVYVEGEYWRDALERVPTFDPSWLASPAPLEPRTSPRAAPPSSDAVVRARAYLRAVPVPAIGAGSDHKTYTLACRLIRDFAIAPDEATELLDTWASSSGWDRWWIAQKVASATKHAKGDVGAML